MHLWFPSYIGISGPVCPWPSKRGTCKKQTHLRREELWHLSLRIIQSMLFFINLHICCCVYSRQFTDNLKAVGLYSDKEAPLGNPQTVYWQIIWMCQKYLAIQKMLFWKQTTQENWDLYLHPHMWSFCSSVVQIFQDAVHKVKLSGYILSV